MSMNSKCKAILLSILLSVLTPTGAAEDSFRRLCAVGADGDPAVRVALSAAEIGRLRTQTTAGKLLPSAHLTSDNSRQRVTSIYDNGYSESFPVYARARELRVSMPLIDPESIASLNRAQKEALATDLDVQLARQESLGRVAKSIISAWVAIARGALDQTRLERRKQFIDIAKTKRASGNSTDLELEEGQVEYEAAVANASTSKKQIVETYNSIQAYGVDGNLLNDALAELGNTPLGKHIDMAGTDQELPAEGLSLIRNEIAVEIAKTAMYEKRAGLLPKVLAFVSLSKNYLSRNVAVPPLLATPNLNRSASVGVHIDIPLYDSALVGPYREADEEYRKAQLQSEAASAQRSRELSGARLALLRNVDRHAELQRRGEALIHSLKSKTHEVQQGRASQSEALKVELDLLTQNASELDSWEEVAISLIDYRVKADAFSEGNINLTLQELGL